MPTSYAQDPAEFALFPNVEVNEQVLEFFERDLSLVQSCPLCSKTLPEQNVWVRSYCVARQLKQQAAVEAFARLCHPVSWRRSSPSPRLAVQLREHAPRRA
jgi:hypothetical protein